MQKNRQSFGEVGAWMIAAGAMGIIGYLELGQSLALGYITLFTAIGIVVTGVRAIEILSQKLSNEATKETALHPQKGALSK